MVGVKLTMSSARDLVTSLNIPELQTYSQGDKRSVLDILKESPKRSVR